RPRYAAHACPTGRPSRGSPGTPRRPARPPTPRATTAARRLLLSQPVLPPASLSSLNSHPRTRLSRGVLGSVLGWPELSLPIQPLQIDSRALARGHECGGKLTDASGFSNV